MAMVSATEAERTPTEAEIKEVEQRLWRLRMALEDMIMRTPTGAGRDLLCDANIHMVQVAGILQHVRENNGS